MPVGDRTADRRAWLAAGGAACAAAVPSGRSFDPRAAPLPRAYPGGIWGFYPRPTPGGQTRLAARTRSRPQPLMGAAGLVLLQPLHVVMQLRQFRTLHGRVGARTPGLP